ncbi:MAG: TRAP transporter permease [Hyphomicrobiales bacterium]
MSDAAGHLRNVLLVAIPLTGVLWLLNVPRHLGIAVIAEEYLALVAGLITAAAFLTHPLRGERPGVLDTVCAAAGFAAWGWMGLHYSDWLLQMGDRSATKWGPGAIALVLLLEALRRAVGPIIAAVIGVIGLYGFIGHWLPGAFEAAYTSPIRMILYLYADSNGVPGIVLNIGASVVLGFILFGAALRFAGGTEMFTDLAMSAMGHRRGGAAKVSIVGSSLFGTLSGSTVGNVMSTGMVTIPLMKRFGFPPHYAAAVEAVASNGGQLAPPVMGATAFLIAEFLQTDYTAVVLAALLPALVYYVVLFMQVDVFARARGLTGVARSELPSARKVLTKGWIFILPLALLVYLLFWLAYSPGRAALYCAVLSLVLHIVATRRLWGPKFYFDVLAETGRTVLPILLVCAAAGIVLGVINITGLGFTLTLMLSRVGEVAGVLPLLLVTAGLSIILGMGMPTAGVYVLLSVLLAPALIRVGIAPMAAHLFIFYFGLLSMLTPPVAIASYAAGSIAGSDMWRTGLAGLRLASPAFLLPFLFCLNPALLMQGTAWEIAVALLTVVSSGYLFAHGFVAQETHGARALGLQAAYIGAGLLIGASTILFGPASPVAAGLGIVGLLPAFMAARPRIGYQQGDKA